MDEMDFDPDTLLTSTSSDPMLGKPPEPGTAASGAEQPPVTSQQPPATPSGSFIVLKNTTSPGASGRVTQLGNISVSSLAPGQGSRAAAASRLTAVMGRAAGSAPGAALTKFIISPTQQAGAAGAGAPVRLLSGSTGVRLDSSQLNSPTKTITLTSAQAQQIGLFSPKKMPGFDAARPWASPQKIVIKSSPSLQSKPQVSSVTSSAPGGLRLLTQQASQQVAQTKQGVQFVRVVGSGGGAGGFVPATAATAAGAAAAAQPAPPTIPAVKISAAPPPPASTPRLLLPAAPPAPPPGPALDPLRTDPHSYSRPPPSARPPQQQRRGGSGRGSLKTSHLARPVGRPPADALPSIRPRKPCNCTKSQCLKLYCDCFASGEFCNSCNCTNCFNSLDHEEERQRAIRSCLDRNPYAFKPKIGKSDNETRKHQKGCNCKKSGCLKNYCECYEAKIYCSSQCKCQGCKNYESSARHPRPGIGSALEESLSLMTLPPEPAGSSIGAPSGSGSGSGPGSGPGSGSGSGRSGRRQGVGLKVATFPVSDRSPPVRVTQDVIDATLMCLMTEAAAAEPGQAQARVLQEFGRCLSEIIDFGARRGDTLEGMAV